MSKPRVLLLRTAGTNCDVETGFAFELAGADVTPVHVRALCEKPELLKVNNTLLEHTIQQANL